MRHVLEAGTDAAWLALFDPAALPDDIRERFGDPGPRWDELNERGWMRVFPISGDWSVVLHVYEDEELPEALCPHIRGTVATGELQTPSGRLWFMGAEAAFTRNEEDLRQSGLGSSAMVTPCRWNMALHWTEHPDDGAGPLRDSTAHRAVDKLLPLGCISLPFALVSALTYPWTVTLVLILATLLLVVLPIVVITRTEAYRAANRKWEELRRQQPDMIAVLKWAGPAEVAPRGHT